MSWYARGAKETVVKQLESALAQPHNSEVAKVCIEAQLEMVRALPDPAEGRVLIVDATGHLDATRPPQGADEALHEWKGVSGAVAFKAEYIPL